MATLGRKQNDIEAGGACPFLVVNEPPEIRWAFIRKVYTILSMQLLLTVFVAAFVVFNPSIYEFMRKTTAGFVIYLVSFILTLTVFGVLSELHKRHPINFVLLAFFTVGIAFFVGLTCARFKGRIVLEAAFLTAVVAVSLTLYTFWAAKRGHDFGFLGPFLFAALMVLICFSIIQLLFPMGKSTMMVFGVVAALIFCGYIIYDTDNLIKRFSNDEYIIASATLYMDIINLFQALLLILGGADE
ncbi:hypothetical protein Tsubulata_028043 [Turnera subulata]|uniref:BI1-like protein n=1 Tax=Turnera subulata TaxID=218843 RepID=A0A9Q0FBV4_9ROSI|nr:hypothetical protein Tsubulata_028043 [Turnera subulata]